MATGPTKVKDSTSGITLPTTSVFLNVTNIAGVVADGATDLAPLINPVIAALTNPTVVYFPGAASTYLFSSAALLLTSNVTLLGDGPRNSVLANTSYGTFAGPLVDTGVGSQIAIKSLGFNYTTGLGSVSDTAKQLAIKVRTTSGFQLEDCTVVTTGTVAAAVGVNSWYSPKSGAPTVSDYRISDNTFSSENTCLQLNSVGSNGYVQDNNFLSQAASQVYGLKAHLCANLLVSGNSLQSCVGLYGCSYPTVADNAVNLAYDPAGGYCVILGAEGTTYTTYGVVSDNSIVAIGGPSAGLYIESGSSDNILQGNNLDLTSISSGANGILVSYGRNSIEGNRVRMSASTSGNCPMAAVAGSVQIRNNYFQGAYNQGIVLSVGGHHAVQNNVIEAVNGANVSTKYGAGIYAAGTDHSLISGNIIRSDVDGYTPAYGVYLDGSASATNAVIGNVIVDAQTALVSVNGGTSANNI